MKPTPWLVGLITTITLALATWTLGAVSSGRERITRVETQQVGVSERLERMERVQDRMERKLDRLIERRN